jgi:hypothetical protein
MPSSVDPSSGPPQQPVSPAGSPTSPAHHVIPPTSDAAWPAQAADSIVDVVDKVRDATTGRVLTVARGLVFGVIAAILAVVILVLALIFGVRLVTELLLLLPWDWVGVWTTYLLFGLVFCVAGGALFRKRNAPST